jgi:riboflavin transporter FmnP
MRSVRTRLVTAVVVALLLFAVVSFVNSKGAVLLAIGTAISFICGFLAVTRSAQLSKASPSRKKVVFASAVGSVVGILLSRLIPSDLWFLPFMGLWLGAIMGMVWYFMENPKGLPPAG